MNHENQKLMRSVELMRSFWNVQKNMMRLVQRMAVENGLSVPQYTILTILASQNEITQKKLGEKTFLPKSTLSQAVDGLVKAGWLNRQQVEGNRREIQLSLSEDGLTFLKSLHRQEGSVHQIIGAAIETLTEKQFKELIETHQQITTYLETQATE
jgi:DNA-binding MarR family transcriptional regulator